MDQATLVRNRIFEARKLIRYLSEDHQMITTAAFWLDALDEDAWVLQIVSPKIDEIRMTGGFLAIRRTLENHPDIHLSLDEISPQRTDDPTIREVVEFVEHYPASNEDKERGIFLKGHFTERAYIYPVNLSACQP